MSKYEIENILQEFVKSPQSFLQELVNQLPKVIRVLGIALGLIFIVFSGIALTNLITDISIDELTRDPASQGGLQFYVGFVSNIGLMIWAASASICLLTATLLWKSQRKQAHFFLASGGLSLMLLFDDTFLLHENVYPRFFDIPEVIVFGVYGLIILWYLVYFRNNIFATDFVLIILALLTFGISLTVDFFEHESVLLSFTEDAFKFIGIVLWLTYFGHTSFQILTKYVPD